MKSLYSFFSSSLGHETLLSTHRGVGQVLWQDLSGYLMVDLGCHFFPSMPFGCELWSGPTSAVEHNRDKETAFQLLLLIIDCWFSVLSEHALVKGRMWELLCWQTPNTSRIKSVKSRTSYRGQFGWCGTAPSGNWPCLAAFLCRCYKPGKSRK